jgi:hypothetical protein
VLHGQAMLCCRRKLLQSGCSSLGADLGLHLSKLTLSTRMQMEEQRAGKHTDLPDFIFSFFQKRVGIPTAVVEVPLPDTRDDSHLLCVRVRQ